MSFWQDLRLATRLLTKDRWFTAAAAGVLAVGIGINAMAFTIVNALLLRSVPIRDAVSNPKYVDPKGQMVAVARSLGVSFGDGR